MNTCTKTGFCIPWSLVFYFAFTGCIEKKDPASVSIQWEEDKAVAIIVPQKFLSTVSRDSAKALLHIRLAKSDQPMIGEYFFDDDKVIFRPIIALTRGLKYNVYVRNQLIDEIAIPNVASTVAPVVVGVYPALDTLPENLLKFYISFSKPMQEGNALNHIHLIRNDRDTLPSVFLDLELWNHERTMLTLWLDPGRIKRDLQPNKLLGTPLNKGFHYQLAINKDWQDAEGMLLKQNFTKNFITVTHDSLSPQVEVWTIDPPGDNTKEHLKINFHESLDHVLAENTMSVADPDGDKVNGKFRANEYGTIAYFIPDVEWMPGIYTLQIESRLEDLAGNNLDRLFDTDLNKKRRPSKKTYEKQFEIR